jgi:hypothetical protein
VLTPHKGKGELLRESEGYGREVRAGINNESNREKMPSAAADFQEDLGTRAGDAVFDSPN